MNDMSSHAPNVGQFLAAGQKKAKNKNPSLFMSDTDKWNLAKYLIEQKLVMLDKDGKFLKFRNFIKDITEEVNTLDVLGNGRHIRGEYQLRSCMEFYSNINNMLGNPITVPVQESVQDDILKAELFKVSAERDTAIKKLDALQELYAKVILRLEDDAKFMTMAFKNEYSSFAANKSPKLKS